MGYWSIIGQIFCLPDDASNHHLYEIYLPIEEERPDKLRAIMLKRYWFSLIHAELGWNCRLKTLQSCSSFGIITATSSGDTFSALARPDMGTQRFLIMGEPWLIGYVFAHKH